MASSELFVFDFTHTLPTAYLYQLKFWADSKLTTTSFLLSYDSPLLKESLRSFVTEILCRNLFMKPFSMSHHSSTHLDWSNTSNCRVQKTISHSILMAFLNRTQTWKLNAKHHSNGSRILSREQGEKHQWNFLFTLSLIKITFRLLFAFD